MTDLEACTGVQDPWKLLQDPKTVSNNPQNRTESAKSVSFHDRPGTVYRVHEPWKLLQDPKTMSEYPQNTPESAKNASFHDRPGSVYRGS